MLEIIGFVVVLVIVGVVGGLVWYRLEDGIFPKPRIYLVPGKKEFILSQGDYRVVFDTLYYIPGDADFNIDGLYISKVSSPKTYRAYLALDRGGMLVGVVPCPSGYNYSSIALYRPKSSDPEWIKVADFEQKQHDILAEHYKNKIATGMPDKSRRLSPGLSP